MGQIYGCTQRNVIKYYTHFLNSHTVQVTMKRTLGKENQSGTKIVWCISMKNVIYTKENNKYFIQNYILLSQNKSIGKDKLHHMELNEHK